MKDVLLLGEPMGLFIAEELGDLSEVTHYTRAIAGAEVNVGIGLARLEYAVDFVTKLGDDPIGKYIARYLSDEKMAVEHIIFDDIYRTGLQLKGKVAEGDPGIAYYRRGSAFSTLSPHDVEAIDFADVKLFHVTGIPAALTQSTRETVFALLEKAKAADTFITFDPNLRPSLWEDEATMIDVLNKIAPYADIILPGISEAEVLTGKNTADEMAGFYHDLGVDVVIIKNGSEGAFVSQKESDFYEVPGYKVEEVVDTVGAGDGFAVGIISGYLDGLSLEESAKRANAIGALQVQNAGDNEGLPTRSELKAYLSSQ